MKRLYEIACADAKYAHLIHELLFHGFCDWMTTTVNHMVGLEPEMNREGWPMPCIAGDWQWGTNSGMKIPDRYDQFAILIDIPPQLIDEKHKNLVSLIKLLADAEVLITWSDSALDRRVWFPS